MHAFTTERMSAFLNYPVSVKRDEDDNIHLKMEVHSNIEQLLNKKPKGGAR